MAHKITLKSIRILLDQAIEQKQRLSLNLSENTGSFNQYHLQWNAPCRRWQNLTPISLDPHPSSQIFLAVIDPTASETRQVVGATSIDLCQIPENFCNELKLCLRLQGMVVGWLFCQLFVGGRQQPRSAQFIYIHKFAISFVQKVEECTVAILLNTQIFYQKSIKLANKSRTLYPNLKQPVRKSDLLCFQITAHPHVQPVSLLIDHIKCGQTTIMNIWIRSNSKKKRGEISLEYFLDSIYFENQQKIFTRKIQAITTNAEDTPLKSINSNEGIIQRKGKKQQEIMRFTRSLKKTILCSTMLRHTVQPQKQQQHPDHNDTLPRKRKIQRNSVGELSQV